jgi:vacuolar protein sorting-associated protein 45
LEQGGEGPPNVRQPHPSTAANNQPPLFLPSPAYIAPPVLESHTAAILAVLLSVKKRPVIRWERMSQAGRKLAQDVQAAIQNPPYRDLFDFRPSAGPAPLLLILGKLLPPSWSQKLMVDRRNDPVTPLLSQWTYQAMVHEMLGITNGRVKIDGEEKLELRVCPLSNSS